MSARHAEPALEHAVFRGVRLSAPDRDAGQLLSAEAGWNQTAADWDYMLREGIAFGFETNTGQLVASALLLPYGGRFAWISMVLVSAVARRQGLASALLRHAIATGQSRGQTLLLDATADGRKVYLPLGFRDLWSATRWSRPTISSTPSPSTAKPLNSPETWLAWDEANFGASRAELLRMLHREGARQAWHMGQPADNHAGFSLGRAGRLATQLGPVTATDEATATTLLAASIDATPGPCFIDVPDSRTQIAALLRARGFAPARHFTRMIHGDALEPGQPERVFAITGPEFG